MAVKATGTLTWRMSSLAAYETWMGRLELPLVEADVISMFVCSRMNKRGFVEAVHFTHADVDQIVTRRLKGVAARQMMSKAPMVQSDPLTGLQVYGFEKLMVAMERPRMQAIFRYQLFTLHTRCRFSDGLGLAGEPKVDADGGLFIEAWLRKFLQLAL
eukprot:2034447-Amphidinium_carterae.2